jgi:hypothetical protein
LRDRLVTVLGQFYDSVSPVLSSKDPVHACDDIKIGGTQYDFISTNALDGDKGKLQWNDTPYSGNPWEIFGFSPGNAASGS